MLNVILKIVDEYLRLILTSWPAVILIIVCLLFFRHKNAIDDFIRRIKFIGPSGAQTFSHPEVEEQQESKESIVAMQTQITELKESLQSEARKRFFERIYGSIFGSQIQILLKVRSVPEGVPVTELVSIYIDTVARNPGLKDYPFKDYINYIVNAGFITLPEDWSNGKSKLTEQGVNFIDYIISENLNLNKAY